ncbi:MAG: hypothetical protein M3P98_00835 [bacterium]|nr:hypothetical protein [bacterium]
MKQKDIAVIVAIVFLSGVLSYVVSNQLFSVPTDQSADVEVVEPITAEFSEPDKRYYNKDSVNPTEPIQIGKDQNQQPFNSTQ